MVEQNNYQMAIDLLCCHLGLSEEEAKKQLGLSDHQPSHQTMTESHHALLGFNLEK
ncbi:hypothetical protein ACFSJQ_05075 [Vibrio olivae]|uniref:Heat-shock protein HtpX n=1 Tax=Vibrio olivae TaxID=1243002 RepID=A0ABV5HJN5_9VIBR